MDIAIPDARLRQGGQGPLDLHGKVAVVTGASSGIGEATARRLAQAGAKVIVGYNNGLDRAERVLESLDGDGHITLRIPAGDTAAIEQAAADVEVRFGRLDVLVNSAGVAKAVPHDDLASLTDEIFDEILAVNLRGPFATIRALTPLLKKSGDSVIVNISSVGAKSGKGSSIAYCASKAAMDVVSMSLARVLGPEIRVVSISPAAVATPLLPEQGRARAENQAKTTPLKTVTEPDDVAMAVLSAVTHLRLMTGATIILDGGRHLA